MTFPSEYDIQFLREQRITIDPTCDLCGEPGAVLRNDRVVCLTCRAAIKAGWWEKVKGWLGC